ncbi:MAG: FdhF/YdeP family oxidoreductase [Solirubrobacterales bacterium]
MALREPTKLPTPKHWASLKPFGIGEQRPNNFYEVFRAAAENSDSPRYAWRILRDGVCDGCALGTKGLRDWTIDGVHLCNVRLRLLRLNTMGAMDPEALTDAEALRTLSGEELRRLGRLPYPALRRAGERGFTRIGWDEALDMVADRITEAGPDRIAFYLTSRGMANENYYVAQKAARAMGTNSIDNAARVCHSPSTATLKAAVGAPASTCSYSDWIGTDLIVFIGSNVANNQPVTTKYLHLAKKAGTKVATVGPYREPGMEAYWIPSTPESALFGTKISDRFFQISTGGDVGFLTGVLKHIIEQGWTSERFISDKTEGFDELKAICEKATWEELETLSGTSRDEMLGLAEMVGKAERGVLVWSMGITQHSDGEEGVRAIVNLALSQGWIGREGCGLMPIRGHSGVQGGAEMGCYSTTFPGGKPIDEDSAAELSKTWGFGVPSEPGLTAPEMIDAAERGELDVLFASGGNFVDVLPDPARVRKTLGRIPLRVHMDITLSAQMLLEPPEGSDTAVLLLPATTRYEVPGGVTETSTERRVVLSPEIPGPRIDEARPEWEVFSDLAARVAPEHADDIRFEGTAHIRREIAATIPLYSQLDQLRNGGDSFQYGGPRLCEGPDGQEFDTDDGLAHFAAVQPPEPPPDDGRFRLSTRRGKQFNSIVQEAEDPLNGVSRESVMMSATDAERLGVDEGNAVLLRSEHGQLPARVTVADIAPGNLQVHWPEGNILIGQERSPESDIPDYNARVEVLVGDEAG